MTHVLSRRMILGSMMGGATFALAGCDDFAPGMFSGAFSGGPGDGTNISAVKTSYLSAIFNAIARLEEQAAAPGTSDDLRNRMNATRVDLASLEPQVRVADDPRAYLGRASTLLEDAADLMIEAGNLKIKQLYDRPPAEGGGSWINAWWDFSSP